MIIRALKIVMHFGTHLLIILESAGNRAADSLITHDRVIFDVGDKDVLADVGLGVAAGVISKITERFTRI